MDYIYLVSLLVVIAIYILLFELTAEPYRPLPLTRVDAHFVRLQKKEKEDA